jgi:hypothetical protein
MELINLGLIQTTQNTLENKIFHLTCEDPNTICHIMNLITKDQRRDFVIMNSTERKRGKDSTEKRLILH